MARVLGVDLGSRRIGLAVSDPSGTVASPYEVLLRSGDRTVDHHAIVAAATDTGAETIVVGFPLSLSGSRGPAARAVQAEVEEIREIAGPDVPVELHDERLSTVTAERVLVSAKMRRDPRRRVVDKVAAAVMLQSYLETAR